MFSNTIHRNIYILGLLIIIVGLCLSPFLISLGQFIITINWVLEGEFSEKIRVVKVRNGIIGMIMLYFVHVLWLLNSENIFYAFHDLKVKLPYLLLPLVMGSSKQLQEREYNFLLKGLLMSVFVAIIIQTYVFFGFTDIQAYDAREASIFVSHIRFALIILITIYVNFWLIFEGATSINSRKYLYYILLVAQLAFIFIVGAYTGIVLFVIVTPIYFILSSRYLKGIIKKWLSICALLILFCSMMFVAISYFRYMDRNRICFSDLEMYTANGNKYQHLNNGVYENKDLVWVNYCYKELKEEWRKRSKVEYHGKDRKDQNINYTLIRYLTSKGLKKDSIGLATLTDEDIRNIEKGVSNYLFCKEYAMYPKLYKIFWQVERYKVEKNSGGHSITQRFEFSKNALNVFYRYKWFGTGIGDIQDEVQVQYELDRTPLDKNHRLRAHNQYITFLASLGIVGSTIILLGFCYLIYKERDMLDALSIVVLVIFLLSMLYEDTLETQVGVTAVAFFVSFFLFARKKQNI